MGLKDKAKNGDAGGVALEMQQGASSSAREEALEVARGDVVKGMLKTGFIPEELLQESAPSSDSSPGPFSTMISQKTEPQISSIIPADYYAPRPTKK